EERSAGCLGRGGNPRARRRALRPAGAALRHRRPSPSRAAQRRGPRAALRRSPLLLPARHGSGRRRRLLRAAELAGAARLGGRAASPHALGCGLRGEWTPHGVLGGGTVAEPGPRSTDAPASAATTVLPPFPADVVDAAAALDLGPELVHLAWELARLASPANGGEARALLLLALAVLAAQRDGSTRLPLDAAGPLRQLLASLDADED